MKTNGITLRSASAAFVMAGRLRGRVEALEQAAANVRAYAAKLQAEWWAQFEPGTRGSAAEQDRVWSYVMLLRPALEAFEFTALQLEQRAAVDGEHAEALQATALRMMEHLEDEHRPSIRDRIKGAVGGWRGARRAP